MSPQRAEFGFGAGASRKLEDMLRAEARLVVDLGALLRRQRGAVALGNTEAVRDSVYATQRVLLTLAEARRGRRSLNRLLGEAEDIPLQTLDRVLGALMTEPVREAQAGLDAAALALSNEVQLNRRALSGTITVTE